MQPTILLCNAVIWTFFASAASSHREKQNKIYEQCERVDTDWRSDKNRIYPLRQSRTLKFVYMIWAQRKSMTSPTFSDKKIGLRAPFSIFLSCFSLAVMGYASSIWNRSNVYEYKLRQKTTNWPFGEDVRVRPIVAASICVAVEQLSRPPHTELNEK